MVKRLPFSFLLTIPFRLQLKAIKKACGELEPGYSPKVTLVVVQKRHHTRFFPTSHQQADKSGNCLAGTVVDSHITHPTDYDFFVSKFVVSLLSKCCQIPCRVLVIFLYFVTDLTTVQLQSHAGLKGTSRPIHYHVLHDENNFTPDALQNLTNSLCYLSTRTTRAVSLVPAVKYAGKETDLFRVTTSIVPVSDQNSKPSPPQPVMPDILCSRVKLHKMGDVWSDDMSSVTSDVAEYATVSDKLKDGMYCK